MLSFIDEAAVRAAISVSDLANEIREIFTGDAEAIREFARTSVGFERGSLLLMPAAHSETFTVKLLSMFEMSSSLGLPRIQGLAVIFDSTSGRPLAVLDAAAITAVRTAAVTTLVSDFLARPDSTVLTIIGAGVQAKSHLEGLAKIRRWNSVRLYSQSENKARDLAQWAEATLGMSVAVHSQVDTAVKEADVICTVTSSQTPLFSDSDVAAGAHISAVGAYGPTSREIPSLLVARSSIFVESIAAIMREAGDILIPIADRSLPQIPPMTELSEILSGSHPGRQHESETTLFKSLGVPIEDAFTCELVYRRSIAQGLGQQVCFG